LSETKDTGTQRSFATGATRDTEVGKLDFEGFFSPLVLERFAEYMDRHRLQKDGTIRDSDNWQQGMPRHVYMKSAWRHFRCWWTRHRGWPVRDTHSVSLEDDLCAVLFNVQGYLHEVLIGREVGKEADGQSTGA